jgi:hypothetical protein
MSKRILHSGCGGIMRSECELRGESVLFWKDAGCDDRAGSEAGRGGDRGGG